MSPTSNVREDAPCSVRIRPAVPADVRGIHFLVGELARYENLTSEFRSTPEDFDRALFGDHPRAEVIVAERPAPESTAEPGTVPHQLQLVGFALFFETFSTFTGAPSLYLEDVFVAPESRGLGIGRRLLEAVARTAEARGCGRLDWTVLDWNTPAIAFYRRLGAELKREWILARLDADGIGRLAGRRSVETREADMPPPSPPPDADDSQDASRFFP